MIADSKYIGIYEFTSVVLSSSLIFSNDALTQFKEGSFFDVPSIPKAEADVILINGVLHDWNDEECITILRNAADALLPGGRIIVTDSAVPEAGHPFFNTVSRLDIFMMTISSGFFRTFPEYDKLWTGANLRLLESRPTRSINTLWVLEK